MNHIILMLYIRRTFEPALGRRFVLESPKMKQIRGSGTSLVSPTQAVVGRMSRKQGVAKTRDKRIMRPESGKSPIFMPDRKRLLKRGVRTNRFQDVRDESGISRGFQREAMFPFPLPGLDHAEGEAVDIWPSIA